MHTVVQTVTPAMAEEFLSNNADFQRAVRWSVVKNLEDCLVRGEWKLTHQGIAFDTNGKLIDGQHRLLAIRRSGISAEMTISYGVDPTCFQVLDIGAKRSTADLLRLGSREAGIVSFLGRLVWKSASSAQGQVIYDNLEDEIGHVLSHAGPTRNCFGSSAVQSAAVVALKRNPHDKEYILDLYENLSHLNLDTLPPIGSAMVRQCFNGKTGASSASRRDMYARSIFVFDPAKRNVQRIQMSDTSLANVLEDTRTLLRSFD